jgi:hypothetical protein
MISAEYEMIKSVRTNDDIVVPLFDGRYGYDNRAVRDWKGLCERMLYIVQ